MKNSKSVFIALVCMLFFVQLSYGQGIRDRYQKPSAPTHGGVKQVPNLPDLIVTNIRLVNGANSSRNTYSGKKMTVPVYVTIKNIGIKSISYRENFDVLLIAGDGSVFTRNRGSIASGNSVTLRMDLKMSINYNNRSVEFMASADQDETTDDVYTGSIKEGNERNNSKKIFLRIPLYRKL
jgi:hypothetical protein